MGDMAMKLLHIYYNTFPPPPLVANAKIMGEGVKAKLLSKREY